MKLLSKLLIIIVLITTIAAALVSIVSFNFTKSLLQATVEDQQRDIIRQTMDKVDRLLYERFNDIQTVAGSQILQDQLVTQEIEIDEMKARLAQRKLEELSIQTGPWDELKVINLAGEVIFSTNPQDLLSKVSSDEVDNVVYTNAKNGSINYSDVFNHKESNKTSMAFASPIRDDLSPERTIIGVVIGHLSWPIVSEVLEHALGIEGSVITLFNKDGLLIANSNSNESEILKLDGSQRHTIREALNGKESSIIDTSFDRSKEVLVSSVPEIGFLSFTGNNWAMRIESPTEIAFAPALKNAYTMILILVPLIFIGSLVMFLFVARILRPISSLTQTAEEITKGDTTKRVTVRSNDEIGKLSKAFNDMTSKLQEDQDRLFKFLDSIPEGVFVLDIMGKPFFANSEAKRLLGKGVIDVKKDQLGEKYEAFLAGTDTLYPTEKMPLVIALTGKSTRIRDMELKHGEMRIPVEVLGAPIVDQEGNIKYAIATFNDITEEKLLERSKDEFFSIASHELRTPLTAIRGNTSLILQFFSDKINENKELAEMINDIHESSTRLISIVNDFLDTSRLELGKMKFKKEEVDLELLVDDVIKEYMTTGSIKKIYLQRQKPQSPIPKVVGDSDRMKQILINLVGNAIKFTEIGGVTMTIAVDVSFAKVLVSDTGKGISRESQNLLFRKFQQATESIFTRDAVKGTGLGLYISKMMAEGMGGEIKLEHSEIGKGTTFSVSLPVLTATNRPVPDLPPVTPQPVITPPAIQNSQQPAPVQVQVPVDESPKS